MTERYRGKTLPDLVSERTAILAGFNYWSASYIPVIRGEMIHIYTTSDTPIQLVIIERMRKQRESRHREWYFGQIPGEPFLSRTNEGQDQFYKDALAVYKRKNRVAGRTLERLIREAIDL